MKSEDVKNYGILAALAVGGLVAWNFFNKAKDQLTTWGEAIGSGLFDFFHKDQMGETLFYTVSFPDGQKHSIASRAVNQDGVFVNAGNGVNYKGDGKRYRIVVDKKNKGLMSAFPV